MKTITDLARDYIQALEECKVIDDKLIAALRGHIVIQDKFIEALTARVEDLQRQNCDLHQQLRIPTLTGSISTH